MTGDDYENGPNNADEPRRQVIEPEVLEPPERDGRGNGRNFRGNDRCAAWHGQRVTWVYGWPGANVDRNGCLAPGISLCLFVICWAQYGFLAALGFVFFHAIFGIIGSVQASRSLMAGRPFNIWLWRCCNWALSLFITVWLAGGLQN